MRTVYHLMALPDDSRFPYFMRLPDLDLPRCLSTRQGDAYPFNTRDAAEKALRAENNIAFMRSAKLQFFIIERKIEVDE